jgi:CHAT domain-containing protein
VPFAELNTLPFQALPWRGRALGLQKSVSYLPAASVLQYFRGPDPLASGALVVGDPAAMAYADAATGRVETLDPLPAARLEAEAVAALHGALPLVGAGATEPAVREALARAPRLIHFATHGFLQEGAPLASGVALAFGEAITADELMGLDLKADVVVLSACDTGRGSLQGSELVGLARGLLYAGARAAVVSLWPVDDVATAMLMEFFHAELRAPAPPADALRRAQQRLQRTEAGEAAGYYARASAAYAEAVAALEAAGRMGEAEHFRDKLCEVELRAESGALSPAARPFQDACHWAAFQVIGDWR